MDDSEFETCLGCMEAWEEVVSEPCPGAQGVTCSEQVPLCPDCRQHSPCCYDCYRANEG